MNLEKLGRRAVACKHWRWMGGMALLYIRYDEEGFHTWKDRETGKDMCEPYVRGELRTYGPFRVLNESDLYDGEEALTIVKRIAVPDLSDPATLGCLLHLVREALGEQSSPSRYSGGKHDYPHWAWYSDNCYGKLCEGATEAECLVRALEAAP